MASPRFSSTAAKLAAVDERMLSAVGNVSAALAAPFRHARLLQRVIAFAAITVGVVGIGATAWAFWTAVGQGTASASTGTLANPTGVTLPAYANGPVGISWTGVSGPGGAPVDGYVIYRSDGAFVCGSSPGSPIDAGISGHSSCTDSSVNNGGAYTYQV